MTTSTPVKEKTVELGAAARDALRTECLFGIERAIRNRISAIDKSEPDQVAAQEFELIAVADVLGALERAEHAGEPTVRFSEAAMGWIRVAARRVEGLMRDLYRDGNPEECEPVAWSLYVYDRILDAGEPTTA